MEEKAGGVEVEASRDSVTGRTIGKADQQSSSFTNGAATALSSASPVQPKTQNKEEFVTGGKESETLCVIIRKIALREGFKNYSYYFWWNFP